jgi:hypothetical protein
MGFTLVITALAIVSLFATLTIRIDYCESDIVTVPVDMAWQDTDGYYVLSMDHVLEVPNRKLWAKAKLNNEIALKTYDCTAANKSDLWWVSLFRWLADGGHIHFEPEIVEVTHE